MICFSIAIVTAMKIFRARFDEKFFSQHPLKKCESGSGCEKLTTSATGIFDGQVGDRNLF